MKPSSRVLLIALAAFLACPALLAQVSQSASSSREPSPRESLRQTFADANQALRAGDFDAAIAGYDKALALDDSQYAIWTNRAMALRMRGASNFNKALAAKDDAGKNAAKRDFLAAVESASKSLASIEALPAPENENARAALDQARDSALEEKGASLQIIGERFKDAPALQDAIAAYKAAIELSRDPQTKNQLRNKEASVFAFNGEYASAMPIYKTILDSDPVNVEALMGAFLACVGLPDMDVKGAREYGARYLKVAPANDPRRKDVQDVLDVLPKLK